MSSSSPSLSIFIFIPIIVIVFCFHLPSLITLTGSKEDGEMYNAIYAGSGWLLNLFTLGINTSMRKNGVKYYGFVTIISFLSIWIPFASFFAMLSARITFPKDPQIAKTYQRHEKQRQAADAQRAKERQQEKEDRKQLEEEKRQRQEKESVDQERAENIAREELYDDLLLINGVGKNKALEIIRTLDTRQNIKKRGKKKLIEISGINEKLAKKNVDTL